MSQNSGHEDFINNFESSANTDWDLKIVVVEGQQGFNLCKDAVLS